MYSQRIISRRQILDIVRDNFPEADLLVTALRLARLVGLTHELEQAEGRAYNAKQQLVTQIRYGKFWKDQGRQRRRVDRIFPKHRRGRPKPMWARYLISSLGVEYMRQTGQEPSCGVWNNLSAFEQFVQPILLAFKIFDTRNLVREYLKERLKGNPWPPGQV